MKCNWHTNRHVSHILSPHTKRLLLPTPRKSWPGATCVAGPFTTTGVPWFETIDRWLLPNTVTAKPVTGRAIRDVPSLAPYDFTVVEGSLLIVNPADRTVVALIRPYEHVG